MLALAAALDQPSAGEVRVAGKSLQRLDEGELSRFRANDLALIFQSDNLWPLLSARENVALALRLAGAADPQTQADAALDEFGLKLRSANRAGALSGGEQQRVAVAAAFAREAQLVLADEPTGELDGGNERLVLDALSRLRATRGCAVVLVTHSSQVAAAADRVIEMRDGAVL